jgi:sterol desaturase/sphingolipid hydroxylase (fatty acid hydroxylase superfamily)
MRIFVPFTIIGILGITSNFRPEFLRLEDIPLYLQVPIVIILFDFLIYWQHRISHIFNPLWRLHKVHHSDTEMDFTTGFRFHPIEIILSAMYKMFFLFIFWPTPEIYIVYEVILSSMAIFNHGNIRLKESTDKFLRKFIVTPQMHFPHHDTTNRLMNMNYGNFLSIWDKIFKTYTDEKVENFGVNDVTPRESADMYSLIFSPFKTKYKK